MRKTLGVLMALLATTFAFAPLAGALSLEFDPSRPPFPAAPTFVSLGDDFAAPPTFVEPFGWTCVETRPWGPEFDPQTGREAFAVEVACHPPRPPPTVTAWTCRNPGVNAYGEGVGAVSGEVRCKTLAGGCTAIVIGAGSCSAVVPGSSDGPLYCHAKVSFGITRWAVSCFNDP